MWYWYPSIYQTAHIEAEYTCVRKECEQDGISLYPEIVLENSDLSVTFERFTLKAKVESLINERDKALLEAKHYRETTETVQREKREAKMKMQQRCETTL